MSEPTSSGDSEPAAKDTFSATAAEHRLGAAYSADLVSISRRVLYAQAVVIAMVAAIFFMAGYVIAPGSGETTKAPVEKKERFGKTVDISGRITYSDVAGSIANDAGAVVIVIPKDQTPSDQLSSDGLRPTDPEPDDAALEPIRYLKGAYLRADEHGEIDMQVRSGRYYVLVISGAAEQGDGGKIKKQDAEELASFFADPQSLIGHRRYDWKLRKLDKDTLLNISLD